MTSCDPVDTFKHPKGRQLPKKPNVFATLDLNYLSRMTGRRVREGKKISIDVQHRQSQIKVAASFFFSCASSPALPQQPAATACAKTPTMGILS
jgi:hypothetical protein